MSESAKWRMEIEGVTSLILHSARDLVDPLSPTTKRIKEITGKGAKKRTEADEWELRRLEFFASLYHSGSDPHVPMGMIESLLIEGAKKFRNGPAARAGIIAGEATFPLYVDGPQTPEDMWEDGRYVFTMPAEPPGQGKVMRTRARFPDWKIVAEGHLDTGELSKNRFEQIAQTAGRTVGLGNWRPQHGRFDASVTWL